MPASTSPDIGTMTLVGILASAVPFLALYGWALFFARRHRQTQPAAYSMAVRGIVILVAGEFVRVFFMYRRMMPIDQEASLQSIVGANLVSSVLLVGFPLVGTYVLIRAIFLPTKDI